MVLFLQFLVLALTGVVWWIARRDLTARAAEAQAPAAAELERLRATVEELITHLEQRAESAEQGLAARIAEARALGESLSATAARPQAPADERYASVHALAAAGVTDPVEIARRTGLGRGEVELILGLRARRVL